MRRRALRPSFVITFGATVAALASACSGGVASGTSNGDGGGVGQQPGPDGSQGGCPSQLPTSGAPCNVPGDCSYPGSCGGGYSASCEQGAWKVTAMNPPAPTCPATKPANGTPCPCFEPLSCHYATATCAGQPQDEIASCTPGGTWQLAISSCNPPAVEAGVGDAAPVDAGTADAADAAQPQDAATE